MHPHEELVVCRDLVFCFDLIIEVYSSQAAVRVYLDLLKLHEFASKGLLTVLLKVENYLIPALVKFEWHWAFERLDTCYGLVIAADKSSFDVFVIKHSDFELEVLVQLNQPFSTFLTRSTIIGIFIFIEADLPAGKAR